MVIINESLADFSKEQHKKYEYRTISKIVIRHAQIIDITCKNAAPL